MKNKLTSRKFITALTGIITGILLIIGGNVTEGTTTLVSAVVAYCIAEGYVDGKRFLYDIQTGEKEENV